MIIDGEKLYEYRIEHGISLEEMSEILDIDMDQLYNYENGIEEWWEEDSLTILTINSMFNDLDFIQIEDIDADEIDELLAIYENN